jgi:hypothetical protein
MLWRSVKYRHQGFPCAVEFFRQQMRFYLLASRHSLRAEISALGRGRLKIPDCKIGIPERFFRVAER